MRYIKKTYYQTFCIVKTLSQKDKEMPIWKGERVRVVQKRFNYFTTSFFHCFPLGTNLKLVCIIFIDRSDTLSWQCYSVRRLFSKQLTYSFWSRILRPDILPVLNKPLWIMPTNHYKSTSARESVARITINQSLSTAQEISRPLLSPWIPFCP